MNDTCIPSYNQSCYELLSWLAHLSMHHREKLKFSLVFVLHNYMHIKPGPRKYKT
jgi:hypothetical protein